MPSIQDLLQPALDLNHEALTWDDIRSGLMDGTLQLYRNDTAALVTQPLKLHRLNALNLALAGGDLAGVHQLVDQAEERARAEGRDRLLLCGRLGWVRDRGLNARGFRALGAIMFKDLKDPSDL